MSKIFPLLLVFSLIAGSLLPSSAQVTINEFSADSTDRLLRWTDSGRPWLGAGPGWWFESFDDSTWGSGPLPVGHGTAGLGTDLPDAKSAAASIYTRISFQVDDVNALGNALTFSAAYNDGFVAILNGVEIARNNLGPKDSHWFYDQLATRSQRNDDFEDFEAGNPAELLKNGENVLAVQVTNQRTSGSMTLDFNLTAGANELVAKGAEVRYKVGFFEPSGGLLDPAVFEIDDYDVGFVDWIELKNESGSEVDLSGWSLTDESEMPDKWKFPEGTKIPANGFLVVLADAPVEPIPNAQYLHANFKLSRGGEYCGLFDSTGAVQSEFQDGYPRQLPFYSYGKNPAGDGFVYFETPTPGGENSGTIYTDRVDAPDFDNEGGFYDGPVTISLSSQTEGALIRFTRDGSEPTLVNGEDYGGPFRLEKVSSKNGHVIRARAFVDGLIPSNTKSNTFLVEQDERIAAAPALAISGDAGRSIHRPHGILSVEGGTGLGESWRARDGDDYNYIITRGRAFERPVHGEYYMAGGEVGFRSDMGIRVAASNWSRPRMTFRSAHRSPWPSSPTEKPSMNIYFRDDYGNPTVTFPLNGPTYPVDTFEGFRMRAGKNDIDNPFVVDELVRRLHRDMGNAASTGVLNSLYVNGELKGYFNLCERLRPGFFKAHYGTPPGVEWDVLAFGNPNGNVADGDKDAWNDLIRRLREDTTEENWQKVLEVADVEGIIDYYLLNIYVAMWDWPHNNWVAAKERSENGRYRLYVWDAEGGFGNRGDSSVSKRTIDSTLDTGGGELQRLWQGLTDWPQYRLLFADRVNKHMFNGGVLDDRDYENSHVKKLVDELIVEFEDLQRAVRNQRLSLNSLISRWARASNGRRANLLGPRRDTFNRNDLWPETTPPEFSTFGGSVANGYQLKLTNEAGAIYYTTNGEDPRLPSGEPNPSAVMQAGSKLPLNLIEAGSTWKVDDSGTDLGTAWTALNYDDANWTDGTTPMGYGGITNTELATQVNAARHNVTYLRKVINIEDAGATLSLLAKVHVDAGAVVYINGEEAFRDGEFADGPVTFESTPETDGKEGVFDEFVVDPALLKDGENIIAIQVHNQTERSGASDMVIDFSLEGMRTNPTNEPIVISNFTTVRARSFNNDEWSAITEADFTVNTVPSSKDNVIVAEFLYNPTGPTDEEAATGIEDGDSFEWIELRNPSAQSVDLRDVQFTDGVAFNFEDSAVKTLSPNGYVLVVADIAAFTTRYGAAHAGAIAGEFTGRLNNGGEQIRLNGPDGDTLHEFTYDDVAPWPEQGDEGHSLQIVDTAGDHNEPTNWRASENAGGLPGDNDTAPTLTLAAWQASFFSEAELQNPEISGPGADADGDFVTNFAEFVFGTSPKDATSVPSKPKGMVVEENGASYLAIEFVRAADVRAFDVTAESSADLSQWGATAVELVRETPMGEGRTSVIYRDTTAVTSGEERYLRLRMTGK